MVQGKEETAQKTKCGKRDSWGGGWVSKCQDKDKTWE